ncbi:hypothetical protein GEMRC1_011391 [Eukaryota sp. GEM-RC1]
MFNHRINIRDFPVRLKLLIESCLAHDPKDRPHVSDIIVALKEVELPGDPEESVNNVDSLKEELLHYKEQTEYFKDHLRSVDALQRENENLKSKLTILNNLINPSDSPSLPVSICFSQTQKSSFFSISDDKLTLTNTTYAVRWRNALGDHPLTPKKVYTWRVKYKGHTSRLCVGVVDERKFNEDGWCRGSAHCFRNCNSVYGNLTGQGDVWNADEVLEIVADMRTNFFTIQSIDCNKINLSCKLPLLKRSGVLSLFCFRLEWACD